MSKNRDNFFEGGWGRRRAGGGRGGGGSTAGGASQQEAEAFFNQFGSTATQGGNLLFEGLQPDTPVKWAGRLPGAGPRSSGFQGSAGRGGSPRGGTLTDVNVALQAFYQMNAAALQRNQVLMFAGGFYGSTDIDDVKWGQYDDASFAAWAAATEQAARRLEAGENVNVQSVLLESALHGGMGMTDGGIPSPEELAMQLEEQEEPGPGEMVQRQGDLISILLSDPNELRVTMDNVASATLGRKARPEEQQMLIGFIHELQRKGQTMQQTAEPGEVWAHITEEQLEAAQSDPAMAMALDDSIPEPEDVTVEYAAPNPQAAAEALLRQENPAEAGAFDINTQFTNFLEMLSGTGTQFPRQTYGGGGGL